MTRHTMSGTTLTLELDQVAALNHHLRRQPPVTAKRLGLGSLPENAVLQQLSAVGPPCYPYILGHFSNAEHPVELHTAELKRLSDRWHLHQRWGVGS